MVYFVYVRARNADGFSSWEPIKWTVDIGASEDTTRILYGLSFEFQNLNLAGIPATLFFKQATLKGRSSPGGAGAMLISDIAQDGNSARYDATYLNTQILLGGATDSFIRATEPGWEIIIDTAG